MADLVPNMKRRQQTPDVLISLRRVEEMRGVSVNGETSIGACTTLHDMGGLPAARIMFTAGVRP